MTIACIAGLALAPPVWAQEDTQATAGAAALTVTVTKPQISRWPVLIPASGRLAAWHEAVIAAEVSGLRIIDVKADVGTAVKKGDLLVQFAAETAQAELEQQQASVEQAEADLEEATANANRARGLAGSGAISSQKTTEYLIAERKAKAALASSQAALVSAQLTLGRTKVYANDDGVISERSASLGKVVTAGDELFKLIRQNRIEWQAELPVKRLREIKEGTRAVIPTPLGEVRGEVRLVSPTTSTTNGRAIVYVALKPTEGIPQPKTGILVSGNFEFDPTDALTVPATAVTMRDGFSYVFLLNAKDQPTVTRKRVETGRRQDNRVEILSGLDKAEVVVVSGGAFLADGSVVRVVDGAEAAASEAAK
ncbi:efflux RND transporter periplasmic adaptor subunit (plasmid) [Shinella zoogloeoides]|nr:efflux RND transporter periplasmic adaptor subunit [Shinella zoogloeoides]WLR95358.1 efflux RND transporter periplasmic adaptor subunit [Shinella zoogloeoides]